MNWYLCDFDLYYLVVNNVEHISMCYVAFIYLHWKNAYSNHWPIFNWVTCLFIPAMFLKYKSGITLSRNELIVTMQSHIPTRVGQKANGHCVTYGK
jgi:hypothetical protein